MTSVFIGGSRRITRPSSLITERLDTIISRNIIVFIGDAYGADKVVQQYLAAKQYNNVIVYCTGRVCRNNIGDWKTRHIIADENLRGFDFYALKDEHMAKEADYGFMLWDGKSKGTLNNILNLLKEKKKVLVYFSPNKEFLKLHGFQELADFLTRIDQKDLLEFERKLRITQVLALEQVELQFG